MDSAPVASPMWLFSQHGLWPLLPCRSRSHPPGCASVSSVRNSSGSTGLTGSSFLSPKGMAKLDGLQCEAMPRTATRRQRVSGGSFSSQTWLDSSPGGHKTVLGPVGVLAGMVNRETQKQGLQPSRYPVPSNCNGVEAAGGLSGRPGGSGLGAAGLGQGCRRLRPVGQRERGRKLVLGPHPGDPGSQDVKSPRD